jgi:hypothetical protein
VRGVLTQVAGMVRWARLVVAEADGTHRVVPLAGDGPPDLAVVEALARYQLMTRRAGGRMWLEELSPDLAELLDLTGLRQEMTGQASMPDPDAASPPEPEGPGPPGRDPCSGT